MQLVLLPSAAQPQPLLLLPPLPPTPPTTMP
jgi:hypothetical protein